MDNSLHKYYMTQMLRDIFTDASLAPLLGFKGGSALMFFHRLPRFSVDLDFNLLDKFQEDFVYNKVLSLAKKYGKIEDRAMKHFGALAVVNYAPGERNMKIEISNRDNQDSYTMLDLGGTAIRVMEKSDMFAHKLCALSDRKDVTGRDVFDCWFFLKTRTPIHAQTVERRMQMPFNNYLSKCITLLKDTSDKLIIYGVGELLTDPKAKSFVKTKMRQETIEMLSTFQVSPLLKEPLEEKKSLFDEIQTSVKKERT